MEVQSIELVNMFTQQTQQTRAGDCDARALLWDHLYSELLVWIPHTLKKRGVRDQDLDDAFHDVVTLTMTRIKYLRDPKALPAYVFRVGQHVARRYRRRLDTVPLVEANLRQVDPRGDTVYDLRTALKQLPPRWAKTVQLVYFEADVHLCSMT